MEGGPFILVPLRISGGMIKEGTTIPEVDPARDEVAWVSGGNYVAGDERVSEGSIWICSQPHSGRTALPSQDGKYWSRGQPSNRWSPFDDYESTPARANGSLTYVLDPGFFTSAYMSGLVGEAIEINVTEGAVGPSLMDPPGPLVVDLWEQAMGLWELLFVPLGVRSSFSLDGMALHPSARLTLTVRNASPTAPVALGTLMLGEWQSVSGVGGSGGVEYGAEAELKSNGFIKYDLDGGWHIVKRPSSINLRLPTVLDAAQADYAVALLRSVLDRPVAVRATNVPGYDYLNTVGLITGPLTASDYSTARASLKVTGAI